MDAASGLYHGWKPSPNAGRSTLDVLYNSALTIFIRCWSALHMNAPGDAASKIAHLGRKIKWMLICIVISEYIAWSAAEEFWHARILRVEFASIPPLSTCYLVDGFLLKMGGISLKMTDGKYFRPLVQHFLRLVAAGQVSITDIPEKDIEDKSRTSDMTKALAFVQIFGSH